MTHCKTLKTNGLLLLKRPVQRVHEVQMLREATTGRVVVFSHTGNLPRVWAVGEPVVVMPPPHVDTTAMNGAPDFPPAAPPAQPPRVEVAFYRKYTEALLRRYLRLSTAAGRVPSLLGREIFRGNVTHCRMRSFEDIVIFCHDMERLIDRLEKTDQQLILRVALQHFPLEEAARMLGLSRRNSIRLYRLALDHMTVLLMEAKMLDLSGHQPNPCQDVEPVEISSCTRFQRRK
jgi:hypothetical protein